MAFTFPPTAISTEERIAMATRCRDADVVPKVHDTGQIFDDPSGDRVQIMHNGLKVLADGYCGRWMTDLIRLCHGHHEIQEERLFYEVLRKMPADGTMLELGGWWAYYSLWFLQDRPNRRAVVLEPDPLHLSVGQRNAALNGLGPAFLQGAVSGVASAPSAFATEDSGVVEIPRYTVAQLMETQGIERLNLLHCDTQGAETDVLESCRQLFLDKRIDWVFVSTHTHRISGDPLTHQRCLNILRESGAVIEAEHDVHESFSGDGLIVARFCPTPADWHPIPLTYNRQSTSLFRHLAYDLAEALAPPPAAEIADAVAPIPADERRPSSDFLKDGHPLKSAGFMFELAADGPLGDAGETLLLPDDREMMPSVFENASWATGDIDKIVGLASADTRYTLLDIGANVGLVSRQLLRRLPNIEKCLCIEPDRVNFSALRFNLVGRHPDIELFNTALGMADDTLVFYRDDGNMGNYSLNPDAMRDRSYSESRVPVAGTQRWMTQNLPGSGRIIWKSDTQGYDELILSETPWDIWSRVDIAMLEMWRIEKPEFDRDAFRERLESFPNRQLGGHGLVSAAEIVTYLSGNDWTYCDLFLWR
jgi:FkbM family methyltransferase